MSEAQWQREVLDELGIARYVPLAAARRHAETAAKRITVSFPNAPMTALRQHLALWLHARKVLDTNSANPDIGFGTAASLSLPALPKLRGDAKLKRQIYQQLQAYFRHERAT